MVPLSRRQRSGKDPLFKDIHVESRNSYSEVDMKQVKKCLYFHIFVPEGRKATVVVPLSRALPRREPMIEGVLSTYSIGDNVRALCTSDKSNPPSQLSWFINGVKAEYWILEQMPTADGKSPMSSLRADPWLQEHDYEALPPDAQGLYTRTLGLNFVTEKRFFIGEPPKMELRCTAAVGNRTWSATVTPTLNALTNLGLAQERLGNHGMLLSYPVTSSWGTLLVLMFSVYTS